ncbi:MAG: S8 family serine peptidase, partial [Pseudomonadota bacterium]
KEHPDLQGNILAGFDFVNNSPEVIDNHGHGTFVAGIIAAQSNDVGIKGLYEWVEIIPVKVIDDHGIGTYEDMASGILYSVDQGAKVINLSMGGYAHSLVLQDAVDYALENGCIVVAGGGNDGLNRPVYPAAYPDVIGVAALGKDGKILPLSNRGRHIAVSAPGEDIISTGLNGQYAYASGTSAATPMVSALAALLFSEQPDLSSSLIQRLLLQSAKDLAAQEKDTVYGKGKIDAEAALGKMVKPFHDVAVRAVHIEPMKFEKGKSTFITASITNAGTYPEEKCDVAFYEIIGEERKEIGRIKATVLDKLKVSFEWKPDGLKESFTFEVSARAEMDSNLSNNAKAITYSAVKTDGEFYILYKNTPPVHQWIGLQAYKMLPYGDLKQELSKYLPTSDSSDYYATNFIVPPGWRESDNAPYLDSDTALIEGMWEEDEGKRGNLPRVFYHFWDPDGGYHAGLFPYLESALEIALEEFLTKAITNYPTNKPMAYYWLGRTAHLLMDMTVPAHVLNDIHPLAVPPLTSTYENFTGTNYKNTTFESKNTDIPVIDSLTPYNPNPPCPNCDIGLARLFYNLADFTTNFDSDNVNGRSKEYGNGKFRSGRNTLSTGKEVSKAEYWKWGWVIEYIWFVPIPVLERVKIRDLERSKDYDILRCGDQHRIYYYRSFYDDINNTARWVKIHYIDGNSESFFNIEEATFIDAVFAEPLECIYQPLLQAKAIGYVAALYQLFWERTHGTLSVDTIPVSGNIYVDDNFKNKESWSGVVEIGDHRVSF